MLSPVVLYRNIEDDTQERDSCARHMPTTRFRSTVKSGSVVIGRYSVLPNYDELEDELKSLGSRLINSWREHRFIADASEWGGPGGALEGMTPRTWRSDEWANLPEGSYALKGRTNSRKTQWATHMFAATRADVPAVASRLYDDPFILQQGLIAREYIPLRKLDKALDGLPVPPWLAGQDLTAKQLRDWRASFVVAGLDTLAADLTAQLVGVKLLPIYWLPRKHVATGELAIVLLSEGHKFGGGFRRCAGEHVARELVRLVKERYRLYVSVSDSDLRPVGVITQRLASVRGVLERKA